MIGRARLPRGDLLICLCVFSHLCIVSHAIQCIDRDGRKGVCGPKQYCREATHRELHPCENDRQNHCCPITPTHRSAQQTTERPPPPGGTRPSTRPSANERPSNKPVNDDPWGDDRENGRQRPPQGNTHDIDYTRPSRRPSANERPSNKPANGDPWGDDRENGRQRPPQGNTHDIDYTRPSKRPSGNERPSNKPPIGDSRENDEWEIHRQRPSQGKGNEFVPNRERPEKPHVSRRPGSDRVYTDDERPTPKNKSSVQRPKVPACGVKPYELFIAGGEESEPHEWPWMTAILRRYPDGRRKTFLCGGSLIDRKYILTAAHCLVHNRSILPASSFVVRLGSHFLNSGEEYPVANVVIHQNHSSFNYFNDIALLRLASKVHVTDKIAPICLPSPDMMNRDFLGELATVCGWGDTVFRSEGTRVLQHVRVPIVSGDECSFAYSRVGGASFLARGSENIICAGLMEGGKDACPGDSGGPLMVKMADDDRWIIVGIVSLGYRCAEPGYPGVYTRVTHYMSWIDENTKKY